MDKIVITCGDPAGVGPEIIHNWWVNHEDARENVVVIGPEKWLRTFVGGEDEQLIAIGDEDFDLTPGIPSQEGAAIAVEALQLAREGCIEGVYKGVVTGPISKEWSNKVGFNYPGQTEYFAAVCGQEPVMGFVGERMIVTLATRHIPLEEVPYKLNPKVLYRTIYETSQLLKILGKERPRIGVCGLNPHAGEGGLLGLAEKEWINPFLNQQKNVFPGLSNTVPGDTAFYRHLQGEFDAIIALYHDQGLGALKTIEFDTAVNVTLGLPFVRTSPDHGVAFDIAGQGIANGQSFTNAMALAKKLKLMSYELSFHKI